MQARFKYFFIGTGLVVVGAASYFSWHGKTDAGLQQTRKPEQVVRSMLAEKKSIPITVSSNGYVTAVNTVDVRPQIQNVVRTVHVREGQEVQAGQLLFTLDARNDTSNVDKARAQLARDHADLADAELNFKRNQELLAKNFVSQAVVDSARNKVDSARATLAADQAAIQSTNISLGYNQIKASISGRIGAISVHPGSLAQPTGAPMVTISQLDPIAVSFSVPERELSFITATYPKGNAPVIAELSGNKKIDGKLIFIDNAADTQSGTIKMKAQFANPRHLMWPGAYVNVQLISHTLSEATVIPAQAIITGPTNKSVYVVQPDSTVTAHKISVLAIEDEQAAVAGIAAGVRVVVEGAQNLRPGSKVKEVQTAPNAPNNN